MRIIDTFKKIELWEAHFAVPTIDTLKILLLWGVHLVVWIVFNVIFGSLPIGLTLLKGGENNPLTIGLLSFCFTAGSSGFYIIWVNLKKGEQDFWPKFWCSVLQALTVVWFVGVVVIVSYLPQILAAIEKSLKLNECFALLYAVSVFLYLGANFQSLTDIVNREFSKQKIENTVKISRAKGNTMNASLKDEEDF